MSNKVLDKYEFICYNENRNMSLSFLQSFGLTKNEIELYELLVNLGEVPIQVILRDTKLKRPTVYKSLYSLVKKGLITKRDLKKKIHFRPESPTKLLELAEKQYQELDRAKTNLQSALPMLGSNYIQSTENLWLESTKDEKGLKTFTKIP